MPTDFDDYFFLAILYLLAYGLGSIVSKFWGWLRILILLIAVSSFISGWNFGPVNIRSTLALIIPMCLFVYPSLTRTFALSLSIPNPFSWFYEQVKESRYRQHRQKELEADRENLERAERIIRMQAEEAERQRQFEREKTEREAGERQKWHRDQQANGESSSHSNNKQESQNSQGSKSADSQSQDPYEVLGVSRDMSKAEIRKAYLNLMNQYAPDHVSHLSKEFQDMAHEKCITFNLAWEKIQKE